MRIPQMAFGLRRCEQILLMVLSLNVSVAQAVTLELVWDTGAVFQTPESVVYDAKRERLYVSNIQGEVNAADQKGSAPFLTEWQSRYRHCRRWA